MLFYKLRIIEMNIVKVIKLSCILGFSLTTITMPMKALACSAQAYLGGMCAFGGNFSIRGWSKAEGQLLPVSSNTALFFYFWHNLWRRWTKIFCLTRFTWSLSY
jgi:hypothetical protein